MALILRRRLEGAEWLAKQLKLKDVGGVGTFIDRRAFPRACRFLSPRCGSSFAAHR